MVPPPHWVPEDDVLLKSAVEAGASLECLAKGATKFSRRYTVKELQDRWYSLLYDPVTVMEASPHMFEVESLGLTNLSRPIKPGSAKETQFGSRKRKSDSIRKCYYAMRKRIWDDLFNIMDIDLLPDPSSWNNNLGTQGQEFDLRPDPFSEFGPHGSHENIQFGPDLDIGHNKLYPDGVPRFDASKELPLCDLFEPSGLPNRGNEFRLGPFRNHACSLSTMPQMSMWDVSSEFSVPFQIGDQCHHAQDAFIVPQPSNSANETDSYLAEISNTLFDDLLFLDNNGKETIDNSYYDGLSSLLLDSPSQAEVGANGGGLPQVETSTTSNVKVYGPEYTNGVICCTLNSEDPEIPSNEDVFLPFRYPSPPNSPPAPLWRPEDLSYLVSPSSVKKIPSGRKFPPVAKNKQKDSCVMGPSQQSDKGLKCRVKDQGVKFELPKSNINHAALRNVRSVGLGNPSRIKSANITANCYIGGGVVRRCGSVEMMDSEKNVDNQHDSGLEVLQSFHHNNNISSNNKNISSNSNNNNNININNNAKEEIPNVVSLPNDDLSCQKAIDKAQLSDMEEWSENDVPYFSDVEAMILDMDLTPDESHLYTNPKVKKYRQEESKRAIIRLEQAAGACTQRSLSSHSAFAVLRSRYSKHFIKKPQVILGRSTEDNRVDIDLGREKNGSKISRRQAIIKLDMHGNFQLTNLGKQSIVVNDKYVLPGQSSILHNSYLIGVRGLPFDFYINRKLVDQFVNSIGEGRLRVNGS